MMGMETYNGLVRTPADAIILFEACRIGLLPRVQRRLSEKERQSIKSGSVFVWDEREAGMRRWTDGKSWSASRVSGSFLTYREMEGKRGGSNFDKNANRDGVQGEQNDSDGGPDGYRYKPDGLMKQSFSITTNNGQHLHLISYFSRAATNAQNLIQPTNDPQLRHIRPEKGMYPESTVHEQSTIPAVTQGPMGSPGYAPSPHQPPYVRPPPYGYAPHGWPPSPMHTPPPHPAYAPYYHPHGPYPGHSPLQNMQYPPPHHGPYAPQMTPFDRPPPPMGQSGMPPGPPGSYGQPPPNGYHTGYQYPANGYHSFQPPPLQTPQNQPQPSSYPPQPPQQQAQQAPQAQTQQQSQPPQPQQQYSSATQQPTPQSQAEETKRSDSHQSPQPERQASAGAQPQPAQPAQPAQPQVSASGTTIPSISAMLNGGEGGQAPPRGSGRNSTSPRPLQDIPMHKLGFEASRDVQALRNLDKSTFKY